MCRTLLEFRLRTIPLRPQLCCQPGTPLTYAEATWSQKLENWIGSHIRAFEFYGGCPKLIVPDTGPKARFRVAPCQRERNPPAGPSVPKPAFFKSRRSFLILFRFQTKLEVRRTGAPDVSLRVECRCADASPPARIRRLSIRADQLARPESRTLWACAFDYERPSRRAGPKPASYRENG